MTLYKRREAFSGLSLRVGAAFSRLGPGPNFWTGLSLLLAAVAFASLTQQLFLGAAAAMIIAAFFDFVDGSVARAKLAASRMGAYLDTVTDRYVEAIIIFGLLFAGLPGYWIPAHAWIFLYLFGSLMTTYAKSAAKEKGVVYGELRGGILERAERMILLFIGLLLAAIHPACLTYVIIILAVLSNASALQRVWIATGD